MEVKILEAGKSLDCGCCGTYFKTWSGYENQDQDLGFGICQSCQGSITEHGEEEWDKAFKTVSEGFRKPENKAKFEAMERDMKKAYVNKMIDKGILKFHVSR